MHCFLIKHDEKLKLHNQEFFLSLSKLEGGVDCYVKDGYYHAALMSTKDAYYFCDLKESEEPQNAADFIPYDDNSYLKFIPHQVSFPDEIQKYINCICVSNNPDNYLPYTGRILKILKRSCTNNYGICPAQESLSREDLEKQQAITLDLVVAFREEEFSSGYYDVVYCFSYNDVNILIELIKKKVPQFQHLQSIGIFSERDTEDDKYIFEYLVKIYYTQEF